MRLTWTPCPCGDKACRLQHPTNLGRYYQGSGFLPEERVLMNQAFALLSELDKLPKYSFTSYEDELNFAVPEYIRITCVQDTLPIYHHEYVKRGKKVFGWYVHGTKPDRYATKAEAIAAAVKAFQEEHYG